MTTRPLVQRVTVYCSSSASVNGDHTRIAERVGEGIARSGRSLVYGGGSVGLMGAVARACRNAGGHVTGVITERLREAELMDKANDENIVVRTMRERKALLESRGDAFLILPGGVGTLEEFFEILVGRLLGEHAKPIAILDAPDPDHPADPEEGYYAPLLTMFDHMIDRRFAKPGVRDLFHLFRDPAHCIDRLDDLARQALQDAGSARPDLAPGLPAVATRAPRRNAPRA
jgi:uncharacterized protein (TIGR00730 family)